jgi:hypothetical protein
MTTSISLTDHFTRVVTPKTDDEEKFFSYRYFKAMKYNRPPLESKRSDKDKVTLRNNTTAPRPRITSFNKGSVYFPYEDREEVLEKISWDAIKGCVTYWNQIAYDTEGEGCRLAFDIDSNGRVLDDNEVHNLARLLWKTLKVYYTDFEQRPIVIYIAKCGPRIKKDKLSTAVHLIAHVKVTIEQAIQITHGYTLRLKESTSIDMTDLEVDAAIYKLSSRQCSLRMIYSNKIDTCPMCEDAVDRRRTCQFCDRDGHVISKSTYVPMGCLDPATGKYSYEYYNEHNPSWIKIFKNYSLWPEDGDDQHTYERPMTDPDILAEKKGANGSRRQPAAIPGKKRKPVEPNHASYELMAEFLGKVVWNNKRWWDGITVDRIQLAENEKTAFIAVAGLGSTMCPYVKRDHSSNRIYFSLTPHGRLTCQCYSKNCKSMPRIFHQVPGSICVQIFGSQKHPSMYSSSAELADRNLDFNEFIKRRRDYTHHVDKKELEKQAQLKMLAEVYQLNGNEQSEPKGRPQQSRRKKQKTFEGGGGYS